MLKNYFIIASRHLAKNKIFTTINVFGLALGMSLNLLYIAGVSFVYSYDDFHTNKDQIYRVTTQVHDQLDNPHYASAPVGLVSKLREGFSGIERVVPVQRKLYGTAVHTDKELFLDGYYVDPEFLQTFSFPLVKGNAATALARPNTLVISESLSTKFFGSKEPMGEIMTIAPYGEYVITGVMKDVPKNSHMQFEALASFATLTSHIGATFSESEESWKNFNNSYIYLHLPKTTEPAHIEHYLNEIAKEGYGQKKDLPISFTLQPFEEIVPGPALLNNIGPNWSYLSFLLSGLLTLIVLVPACSNYITLSIAQSLNRMKEIGVRKVMGGSKRQIFFQFIAESTIVMLLALVVSYLIYGVIYEECLRLMGATNILDLSPNFLTIIFFILFALLVAWAAGFIPALYFAKLSPVVALKAKPSKTGKSSFPLQKVVIAAQFMLSIGFIMAVVVVIQQYRYSVNYNFDFEQENILNVELHNVDPQIFKNEYGKLSAVEGVSMSSHILGIGSTHTEYIKNAEETDSTGISYVSIDENYIPNLNLKLLAGNNFSTDPAKNHTFIIVNEEFVKKLSFPEPFMAIGKSVVLSDGRAVIIGGVVQNFHYTNLLEPIESFFFKYDPDQFAYANLQLSSREAFKDLSGMNVIWKNIGGVNEVKAQFFNDQIDEAYGFYLEITKVWGFLGLMAITVACLGLLGTVVFTIKNRLKEVSIRKVLGASSKSLVFLLSKDYLRLMGIASLIAVPLTYLLLDHMVLSIQHYRIEIGLTEIVLSLLIVVAIGLTTILSQTLKAARANPVDNLKSE